jgi:hypothetical protein
MRYKTKKDVFCYPTKSSDDDTSTSSSDEETIKAPNQPAIIENVKSDGKLLGFDR